jgi:aminoglycoside/choline kinase family phosphotransferase
MPGFTPALYRWERDYFARHFLGDTLGMHGPRVRRMLDDLENVARRLGRADRVLLHRDLQSGNVLVRGTRIGLIDFQGMRRGPAAYDLASLLCDPYVRPPAGLRAEMIAYYAGLGKGAEEAAAFFNLAAVQRLAQALGAYGRLATLPGGGGYRLHMVPAVALLREMIDALSCPLPALADGLEAAEAVLAAPHHKPG